MISTRLFVVLLHLYVIYPTKAQDLTNQGLKVLSRVYDEVCIVL